MTDVTTLKLALIEILGKVGDLEEELRKARATCQHIFDLRQEDRRKYDELYAKYIARGDV